MYVTPINLLASIVVNCVYPRATRLRSTTSLRQDALRITEDPYCEEQQHKNLEGRRASYEGEGWMEIECGTAQLQRLLAFFFQFDAKKTVYDATELIREKVPDARQGQGEFGQAFTMCVLM